MICTQCAAMCLLSATGPPVIRVQSVRVYEMRRPPSQSPVPVPGPGPGPQSSQISAVPFLGRSRDSPALRPMAGRRDPGRPSQQRGTRACRQPKERAPQAMDQMSGCCTCGLPAACGIGWVGWLQSCGWWVQVMVQPCVCLAGCRSGRTYTASGPQIHQRLRSSDFGCSTVGYR